MGAGVIAGPCHSLDAAMESAIERCRLDLRGLRVLTEAATGAYSVTAVMAAMAGAERVYAFARDSQYGPREAAIAETAELAARAGVLDRMVFPAKLSRDIVSDADIVTNSGHLRPIGQSLILWMKSTAAIPLMYEAWEFRQTDVDLRACRQRGIPVAGTNERHPAIDVFSFLGAMAVRLLADAGLWLRGSRVLVLCDNNFAPFIRQGLCEAGAEVEATDGLPASLKALSPGRIDAVLVALRPHSVPRLGFMELEALARLANGALLAQFWGDVDRVYARQSGFRLWPLTAPADGHMGILPSALGPEPIARLQSGGLKAGEIMTRAMQTAAAGYAEAVRASVAAGFGQAIPEFEAL